MDKKCIVIFMMDDAVQTYNGKPLMLQEALFCPVLTWCMRAWTEKGIGRFFIVCDPEFHEEVLSCLPDGVAAAVGTADTYEQDIAEFAKGCWIDEIHEAMLPVGSMMLSFRTVPELIRLQQAVKEDIAVYHANTGVNVLDPDHTYIDPRVTIGAGTTILPGTILRGHTVIGDNCQIGPNSLVDNCVVGDGSVINASQAYSSTLGRSVHVGPFAHVRPGCQLGDEVKVGAYVEVKNATFGHGTKMSHLTYVGDADVGADVNFGCGTITSNYDGFHKARTVVEDGAFIGCNTNLVAPVTVGTGAYVAAGTTVTKDVDPDSLAISRVKQELKPGWAKKRRDMHSKK